MTRVTFALSVLLILIGGACIAIGLPEIQLERGWAAVISGSIVASTGCATFAIGAVLTRLDALRVAVAGLSVAAPRQVETAEPEDRSVGPVPLEDGGSIARPLEAEGRVERGDVTFAFPEPPFAAEPPAPEPLSASKREDDPDPYPFTPSLPPNEPAEAARPGRARSNFLRSFRSRRAAQVRESAPRSPSTSPVVPVDDFVDDPPLARHEHDTESPFADPTDREPFEVGASEPLRPTYAEDLPEDAHPARPFEPMTLDAIAEDGGPAPDTAPSTDHPLRPSVVGRYTAGSASYVMYSNGMIEVETEGGVHQFGSMQELKSFIESQEAARV